MQATHDAPNPKGEPRLAFMAKLRCARCGSTEFTFRHPSGRPRCALCGTFAHGPEVAKWRFRRRLTTALVIAAIVAIAAAAWEYLGS